MTLLIMVGFTFLKADSRYARQLATAKKSAEVDRVLYIAAGAFLEELYKNQIQLEKSTRLLLDRYKAMNWTATYTIDRKEYAEKKATRLSVCIELYHPDYKAFLEQHPTDKTTFTFLVKQT